MAILNGYINLSKIDKELIQTNAKGEKILWLDLYTYDSPDQYGNMACLRTYNSRTREKAYIANFRKKDIQGHGGAQGGTASHQDDNDLGF